MNKVLVSLAFLLSAYFIHLMEEKESPPVDQSENLPKYEPQLKNEEPAHISRIA
ncbi:hypothetical protein MADA3029_540006 [Vibrio nigripulchritudo MADA3029]|uniref:hypothetical protein n=1 Tax=Vibrio nigripulchritudo TaxID=28173 RepID=UPI0003B1D5E9|nr:hypothetical protein [Vibrio nigripulchritudo]CCN50213.1 hypothetical protein VIBNIMADA3020_890006 [Vibrio nigripulchritudo MADA3020]CCN53359.1 hypothetical protein VIBNIMADA3021_290086 [Vibrio nigripulchritudo MADA3021]CCN60153.1 hypothetical protein MADA3029_540006 [Vibrio nigripulchritudo MADA3029]